MRALSLSSVAFSLLLGACSSDESSPDASGGSAQTGVNSNNPAGAGGGGSGAAGAGTSAGAGGLTGSGGTEGGSGNIVLNQGGMTAAGGSGTASAGSTGAAGAPPSVDAGDDTSMSFFVTSRGSGSGGDFGGIAGADEFCRTLAAEASAELGAKTWRAYLSTSTEDARDRIGDGPWRNAVGRIIANDITQLHDQQNPMTGTLNATWPTNNFTVALDETGAQVPAQPVLHDIITGSNADGTVSASGTCSDWTAQTGGTRNGHSNRAGGGDAPQSWSSSHNTGCGEPTPGMNFQMGTVSQGGGRGSIYCFAID